MTEKITQKYKIIQADEGMRLTAWNEGDDIFDWTSFRMMYTPLTADTTVYREITEEEAAKLDKELSDLMEVRDGYKQR